MGNNLNIYKQFTTYEIALKVKELGFNEPCFAYFDGSGSIGYCFDLVNRKRNRVYVDQLTNSNVKMNRCTAPLWQQAIDWLLKKLDFYYPYLKIEIFSDDSGAWYQPKDEGNDKIKINFDNLEQAILKAIELCQKKK